MSERGMDRRDFLHRLGLSGLALGMSGAACGSGDSAAQQGSVAKQAVNAAAGSSGPKTGLCT